MPNTSKYIESIKIFIRFNIFFYITSFSMNRFILESFLYINSILLYLKEQNINVEKLISKEVINYEKYIWNV